MKNPTPPTWREAGQDVGAGNVASPSPPSNPRRSSTGRQPEPATWTSGDREVARDSVRAWVCAGFRRDAPVRRVALLLLALLGYRMEERQLRFAPTRALVLRGPGITSYIEGGLPDPPAHPTRRPVEVG